MKRIIFVLLVLILAVNAASAMEGTVVSTIGKVEIQKGASWVPLAKGDKISGGAIISTGFKSEAVLKLGESTVQVKPLSRLTLEQLANLNGNHKTSVYLDVGSVTADVKAAKDKKVGFTVKSPVATASVRGTKFRFSGEKLHVFRGKVGITRSLAKAIAQAAAAIAENEEITQEMLNETGKGREIFAKAGQEIKVSNNGNVTTPFEITASNATNLGGSITSLSSTEKKSYTPPSVSGNTSAGIQNTGNLEIEFKFRDWQ
jgi:hypothetical protein